MTFLDDVFISYSRHDKAFVKKLVERLKQAGVDIFYDEADIAIGESLAHSLQNAVQRAQYVLIVMSPEYFSSQWGKQELDLALQQEFENNRRKVIPLLHSLI
ncbi:MAG: toll/interleukin-1 receptor domain-containing protein [Candidatus Thiodiazotropha sp.]